MRGQGSEVRVQGPELRRLALGLWPLNSLNPGSMTKRKSPGVDPESSSDNSTDTVSHHMPSAAAIRETIESVVIAFVLAFLFRTFEAEAFVIPTGSMAPTLMGRHKDLTCPKCGSPYQVSASEEVDQEGAGRGGQYETAAGACPMCRATTFMGPGNPQHINYPSYNGDRILVSKFAYEFADPKRWDVIVFKFPGDATTDARTNFIKRLIGLPGETVRIQHGDIWTRRGEEPFTVARKPPEKLLAVLQPVFDNDYMPRIAEYGWPARWKPESPGDAAWTSDDKATFHTDGAGGGENWLRYHHLVPNFQQWKAVEKSGAESVPQDLTPQLITDFTAYDTNRAWGDNNPAPMADSLGMYWVGDLALRFTADVESEKGELLVELRKGSRRFQCRIDVATGKATLSINGLDSFRPSATTAVRGPGRHEIRFSNCDNELRLWVDGSAVSFDAPTIYDDLGNFAPDANDRAPVGVASVGAKMRLSHLAIFRDLYYIAEFAFAEHLHAAPDPIAFTPGQPDEDTTVRNRVEHAAEFKLKADQFFVLGDNSARSKDGRLWGADNYWVPRELLIGKALFIYWPHSWNRVPYVNVPFPFFPNFARMGLVR